jgi:hypothetical protein
LKSCGVVRSKAMQIVKKYRENKTKNVLIAVGRDEADEGMNKQPSSIERELGVSPAEEKSCDRRGEGGTEKQNEKTT